MIHCRQYHYNLSSTIFTSLQAKHVTFSTLVKSNLHADIYNWKRKITEVEI